MPRRVELVMVFELPDQYTIDMLAVRLEDIGTGDNPSTAAGLMTYGYQDVIYQVKGK